MGGQEAPAPHSGALECAVSAALGRGYELVASRRLVGMCLGVWARVGADGASAFVDVATDAVGVGVGGVYGNKGAVAVSITHAPTGVRVLFVAAHLAAHQDEVAKRNGHFATIDRSLFANGAGSSTSAETSAGGRAASGAGAGNGRAPQAQRSSHSASAAHDLTFFAGDLNYRVEGNRAAIDVALQHGLYEVLAANDQLRREMSKGRAFRGFREAELTFMPTYKFDSGTDTYDTSIKARIPSWTDRVLHRVADGAGVRVAQRSYQSVASIRTSDHKAVTAEFVVTGSGSGHVGGAGDVALSPRRRRRGGSACLGDGVGGGGGGGGGRRGGEGGACALQ